MSYAEDKSKNFSYYCREGKITFVNKWIDNPNVDINWNYHSPLRNAVRYNQIDIIDILLSHPKLKTDYENQSKELSGEWNGIPMVFNPFTEAMKYDNFEVLDIFVKSKKFKIDRKENLNILLSISNPKMIKYFLQLDNVVKTITDFGGEYLNLLPEEIKDTFIF